MEAGIQPPDRLMNLVILGKKLDTEGLEEPGTCQKFWQVSTKG